jgi:Domain of unknown function (DUF4357)
VMGFGRSIELYLVDGRPEGLLTAKVFNWTGQVLRAPRLQIKAGLARPEADYTGVYVLLGEREGVPLAYIGEGEEVGARIRDHDVKRDWWTDAILVTTSANELNKAHVKYLEHRLVQQAREAGTMALENGNTPPKPGLSEASRANMEEFLDTLFMVLPALGVDLFTSRKRPVVHVVPSVGVAAAVHFQMDVPRNGVQARAVLVNDEFVVQKGSIVRAAWESKGAFNFGYRDLQERLVADGVIVVRDGMGEFAENYAFSSPSAAAAVVAGRTANGRTSWKLAGSTKTYADWDAEQLGAA